MTNNSNNEMWFQEMDRTNPLDTTKSEERPEGSLNADTLAEVQVDNSLNTEVGSQSPEVANQSPEVANMFNLEGTSCSEELRTKHVKSSTIRTQDVSSNMEEELDSVINKVRQIKIHCETFKDVIYPGLD